MMFDGSSPDAIRAISISRSVSPLLHLSRLPSAHLGPCTGRSTHQHPVELPLPHSSTSSLHGPLPLVSRHRQTDTTPRKAGHMSRIQQHNKKCALKFWRTDAHKPRTALCSTVLACSDTVTVAWSIPWPVSGHQRLDTCRCPLSASQQKKQSLKKQFTRPHQCRRHQWLKSRVKCRKAKLWMI